MSLDPLTAGHAESDAPASRRRWVVAQLGSREHYAAARAFHLRGRLRTLYTDVWAPGRWGRGLLRRGPASVRALANRHHPEIPPDKVVSFTPSALFQAAVRFRHRGKAGAEERCREFAREGQWFCASVNRHLARQPLDPETDAYFGYDSACLETLEMLRPRGVLTVVDQIDPARVEAEMVVEECRKWPGWQDDYEPAPPWFWDRLRAEWDAAGLVLVNSNWSKVALERQGVPAGKIIVVPLAYEPEHSAAVAEDGRRDFDGPLTVLWLGAVILRKGIQYLVEAAGQLRDTGVRFEIAGPVQISADAVASAPPNVSFIGRVPRDLAPARYRAAHVFVLPTISDGFAITQIEAMAHGLPVVATPNCGDVVTDGVDGFLVPPADAGALAGAIAKLDADRPLLRQMSRRAVEKSGQFSLAAYAQRLEAAVAAVGGLAR